jgi:hypothetical protein
MNNQLEQALREFAAARGLTPEAAIENRLTYAFKRMGALQRDGLKRSEKLRKKPVPCAFCGAPHPAALLSVYRGKYRACAPCILARNKGVEALPLPMPDTDPAALVNRVDTEEPARKMPHEEPGASVACPARPPSGWGKRALAELRKCPAQEDLRDRFLNRSALCTDSNDLEHLTACYAELKAKLPHEAGLLASPLCRKCQKPSQRGQRLCVTCRGDIAASARAKSSVKAPPLAAKKKGEPERVGRRRGK